MHKGLAACFLVSLIFFGCFSSSSCPHAKKQQIDVHQFVVDLSRDESLLLEYFFRCLIQEDSIGYVLLGAKPMSFFSYLKPKIALTAFQSDPVEATDLFFEGFDSRNSLFERGFEVWKKYQHLFCGNNIFFDFIEQDRELFYKKVSVFNKKLILEIIDSHFQKFKRLGHFHITVSIFNALLRDSTVKHRFYAQDDLLGICLGYGERNATQFREMTGILKGLGWLGFTLREPSEEEQHNLEKQWTDLKKRFRGGFQDHVSKKFLFHLGVGFRSDLSDPETLSLQKKYSDCHKQLTQEYNGAAFLEKTLELIIKADRY